VKVLVVNGRKMNSFALALESGSYFSTKGHKVFFIDSNPFFFTNSSRVRVQREIIKKQGFYSGVSVLDCVANVLKAATYANAWCKLALKSNFAWDKYALNGELPLGRLVKSLISRSMGSSNFQLSDCPPKQVFEISFKSIFSYLQTVTAIKHLGLNFDLAIAHGGRDAYSAGAMCAFRKYGIQTRLVESGGVPTRWSMFDTSPHFSPDFWERLEKTELESHSIDSITEWWEKRLAGSDHFRTEEWGHTRTSGLLPSSLPKVYLSFFTTSDFEIPVFDDFDIFPGEFKNQAQAFNGLYKVAREMNVHIVVRRHPNSVDRFGEDREVALWRDIRNLPGVTYLGPHEKVDSIALARDSRLVFTFKSSVGIEAIWLGTPAFALGPARWAWTEDLRAWDMNRLKEVIAGKFEVNQDHAIRWANMMLTMDFPSTQFKSIQGNKCTFGEIEVRNSNFEDTADKLMVYLLEKITKVSNYFNKEV
jgi:hypothetical protein